jgi:hypothetical protein
MGGSNATSTPQDAVTQLLKVFAAATPADAGRFINVDGTGIPW